MHLIEAPPLEARPPLRTQAPFVNRKPVVLLVEDTVASLFSNGEQGAWYDPSDLSTMFTDIFGATPVTATGQTVGLILDKRLGATPSTADQWVDARVVFGGESTRVDATTYRILSTAGVNSNAQVVGALVVGQVYRVTFTVVSSTGVGVRVGDLGAIADAPGTYTSTFVADSTIAFIKRNGNITDTVVTDISFRLIPGNHAYQATSASRPIFRDVAGLRYLEFDGVDDYLRSTFTITQPIDRISAIRQVTWINGDRIFGGGTANAADLFQNAASPWLGGYAGTMVDYQLASPAIGVTAVLSERFHGASSRMALNNGPNVVGNTGTNASGGITIGAFFSGAAYGNFLLHQLIMRGGPTALTDAQITSARALCTLKAGLVPDAEILKLFAAGQQGAWYDPSDLSTMQQAYNHGTPVSATGQGVGILLDKSLGLAQTPNLMTDPDTGTMTPVGVSAPTFSTTTHLGLACRQLVFNMPTGAGGYGVSRADTAAQGSMPVAPGALNVSFEVSLSRALTGGEVLAGFAVAPTDAYTIEITAANSAALVGAWGRKQAYKMTTPGGAAQFSFYTGGTWVSGNPLTVYIRAVVINKVLGNHAYQTTSGSRPIFRDVAGLRYLDFDGVDDSLQTAAINFTSTDKMLVAAGLLKTNDAATRILLELSANSNSNDGSFYVAAPVAPATTLTTQLRGTATGSITVTAAAGSSFVYTSQMDIAAAGTPAALVAYLNGVQSSTSAAVGTGNFGNYPLYIGARAGTSIPFLGSLYQMLIVGKEANATEVLQINKHISSKSGAPL